MAFIFPYIGNVIIPIDESFSEGLKPPTSNHIRSNCIWSEGNGEREREKKESANHCIELHVSHSYKQKIDGRSE